MSNYKVKPRLDALPQQELNVLIDISNNSVNTNFLVCDLRKEDLRCLYEVEEIQPTCKISYNPSCQGCGHRIKINLFLDKSPSRSVLRSVAKRLKVADIVVADSEPPAKKSKNTIFKTPVNPLGINITNNSANIITQLENLSNKFFPLRNESQKHEELSRSMQLKISDAIGGYNPVENDPLYDGVEVKLEPMSIYSDEEDDNFEIPLSPGDISSPNSSPTHSPLECLSRLLPPSFDLNSEKQGLRSTWKSTTEQKIKLERPPDPIQIPKVKTEPDTGTSWRLEKPPSPIKIQTVESGRVMAKPLEKIQTVSKLIELPTKKCLDINLGNKKDSEKDEESNWRLEKPPSPIKVQTVHSCRPVERPAQILLKPVSKLIELSTETCLTVNLENKDNSEDWRLEKPPSPIKVQSASTTRLDDKPVEKPKLISKLIELPTQNILNSEPDNVDVQDNPDKGENYIHDGKIKLPPNVLVNSRCKILITRHRDFEELFKRKLMQIKKVPYFEIMQLPNGSKLYFMKLTDFGTRNLYMSSFDMRTLTCDICQLHQNGVNTFIRHRNNHFFSANSTVCCACKTDFKSHEVLSRHVMVCSYKWRLVKIKNNKHCEGGKTGISQLNPHQMDTEFGTYLTKDHFSCELCSEVCQNSQQLMVHKRQKHLLEPFKCNECTPIKYFSSKEEIRRHLIEQHFPQLADYHCEVCSAVFLHENSYKSHYRKYHPVIQNHRVPSIGENALSLNQYSKNHINSHTGKLISTICVCIPAHKHTTHPHSHTHIETFKAIRIFNQIY